MTEAGLLSVSYYLVWADVSKGERGRDWVKGRGLPGGRGHAHDGPSFALGTPILETKLASILGY